MEYAVLGRLIKIRKEKGLSQSELAEKSGNRQQVISRIENKENSPTLKTICSLLDVLDYEIQLVPKERDMMAETPIADSLMGIAKGIGIKNRDDIKELRLKEHL